MNLHRAYHYATADVGIEGSALGRGSPFGRVSAFGRSVLQPGRQPTQGDTVLRSHLSAKINIAR
jgi:hypothetical protein